MSRSASICRYCIDFTIYVGAQNAKAPATNATHVKAKVDNMKLLLQKNKTFIFLQKFTILTFTYRKVGGFQFDNPCSIYTTDLQYSRYLSHRLEVFKVIDQFLHIKQRHCCSSNYNLSSMSSMSNKYSVIVQIL